MKIEQDKWNHIFVGLVIGLVVPFILNWVFDFTPYFNIVLSAIMLIMISYGFELFSLLTGWGHYDIMDAVATVAGGIPTLALAALLL